MYVERMLVAAENLLAINRELKQNALLNDCSLRRQLVGGGATCGLVGLCD